MKHECKETNEQRQMAFICHFTVKFLEKEKVWVISAEDEYESTINYCPFCGEKLKQQKEAKKK